MKLWLLKPELPALNYFNYFTEVEDTFVRRRARHLLLSSIDWALIESWKEMGIPLHIVLRGIEKSFDSWESKPRKRSVKTLLYCQEEVEAQYAEWLESRVGAEIDEASADGDTASPAGADTTPRSKLPFPREDILAHLRTARETLTATVRQRNDSDEISEAMTRAAGLLQDLEKDFGEASQPDAQKLEVSLTGIERMLSEALNAVASASELDDISSEIKKQLRPYRSHMETSVYDQTLNNLLLKRLREHFGVPRLSLFYL